jgi:hypothetical protein
MARTKPRSIFLESYGDNPLLRVMDFFVIHQDFDYSKKDIARHSKISYSSLKLFWDDLVKRKIVVFTRKVGKAKMYKLNKKNPEVKAFMKFFWVVVDRETERMFAEKEQKKKVVICR